MLENLQEQQDFTQVQDGVTPTDQQQGQDVTLTSDSEGLQEDKQGKDMDSELETLRKRVAELEQYAPQAKTEQELALEQKEQELWAKEVSLTLKEHNLEPFADFINAGDSEQLNKQVESLKSILAQYKLDSSFVPSSHKLTDRYSLAEQQKDSKKMISTKLSQLFK